MTTLADVIGGQVQRAVAAALEQVVPSFDGATADAITKAIGEYLNKNVSIKDWLIGLGILSQVEHPAVAASLAALEAAEHSAGAAAGGFGAGYMLGYAGYQALLPLLEPLLHAIAAELTNEIFDADTAAQLVSRGLMEHGHGADEAAGTGFDADHFDHLVSLRTTRPAVDVILTMWNRDLVQESTVDSTLHLLGYDAQMRDKLKGLARNLLSPADLALANLRGTVDENVLRGYAKQLGITDADMQVLIANTGEPPGLMELLEAYRRGFISREELEHGIRQSRVRNEWIPTIERLRYTPMSTTDAVRAHVENYITEHEAARIADQNGLEPGAIDILIKAWGRPLAHMEMGELVHRGLASREQFDQAMRESDMKDKYIGLAFDITTRLLSPFEILRAVRFTAISLKDAARMLLQQGYQPDAVSVILKTGLHEQTSTGHELTRSQITTMYGDGILTKPQTLQHLEHLGYSPQDAGYMVSIVDTQMHAKELRAEVATIRTSYLGGGITEHDAEAQLVNLGETRTQAIHNIGVWNHEKRRAARTLSESQIVKAAKAGTVKPDEAITLLEAVGYSRHNATVLLNSNGVSIG